MLMLLQEKDIYKGNLILVNADHAYRDFHADRRKLRLLRTEGADSRLENKKIQTAQETADRPAVTLNACAADYLYRLLRAVRGLKQIVLVSGWRSMQEQQKIWDDSLLENGQEFTETYVAVPGHSEHQTGLAVDLGEKKNVIDFIRPDFPYEGVCQLFREKAAAYGFVERYPKGKEAVTGIGHEPWHFRYVGAPHADIMYRRRLTLEEYLDFLRQFPYGKPYRITGSGRQEMEVSFVQASGAGAVRLELDMQMPYTVSGNNVDGFIITEWRRMYA